MNKNTRQRRLETDDHECQLSKLFGIAHLSGKPCSNRLEVHHITYERYGKEEPKDLITVCSRCHDILTDAIRRERFSTKSIPLQQEQKTVTVNRTKEKRDTKIELQDSGSFTAPNAQRPTGRPVEYLFEEDERDFLKAQKD